MSKNEMKKRVIRYLKRYYNRKWIYLRLIAACRLGERIIKRVKNGHIHTAGSLAKALLPVYRHMNLAWNGCCSPETDLRKVPIGLMLGWEELPAGYWTFCSTSTADSGIIHPQKIFSSNRRIPRFLMESLIQDLHEVIGDLHSLSKEIMDDSGFCLSHPRSFEVSLAHSYLHLNLAINSSLSVTQKEYRTYLHDEKSMRLFIECSRWPEAIARELGPDWVMEMERSAKA